MDAPYIEPGSSQANFASVDTVSVYRNYPAISSNIAAGCFFVIDLSGISNADCHRTAIRQRARYLVNEAVRKEGSTR
jgi:hypothetical protein